MNYVQTDSTYADTIIQPYYRTIAKAQLQQMISDEDSIQKVNDSLYILFDMPDFAFIDGYNNRMSSHSVDPIFTSQMIYANTLKHFSPPDKTKITSELNSLLSKYYTPENENHNYVYDNDAKKSYISQINKEYELRNVSTSIDNISNKINRFKGDYGTAYFRFWFYFTFMIALLLFIFRHSTTRTFFLSLLTLIVITILTSLIGSFLNNAAYMFFIWCFFYFILFSVLGALVFSNKVRSVVTGISINLWMLLVPFLPLLITGYYYERQQEHDMIKHIIILNYEEMHRNMLIAEIAGPLIFCLLLFTYIHKLYRNWYALPEQ